jgi:hypothetical protein
MRVESQNGKRLKMSRAEVFTLAAIVNEESRKVDERPSSSRGLSKPFAQRNEACKLTQQ